MNLDEELRSALRRRDPSPDFTARVLARVAVAGEPQAPRKPQAWFGRPVTRWVAGMAAALVMAAGAFEYRQYEGERAKEKVLLAMRITALKLNKAQKKVQMITHRSNS